MADKKFFQIEVIKGISILGIILNHLVEANGYYARFTNPEQLEKITKTYFDILLPESGSWITDIVIFIGWLGDSMPGVFIFTSGLGLILSTMRKGGLAEQPISFYKRRLLKIYPLYITVHLLVWGGMIVFSKGEGILSGKMILSILGIRFTDELFFFLNPSWWFIWLIVQLYLLYPLLLKLLEKTGIKVFLIITIVLTLIFRGMGLSGYYLNNDLYFWMTGIFAGTRLAEFSAGMAAGFLLYKYEGKIERINGRILLTAGVFIYLTGLTASFTYIGSLISNFFITLGAVVTIYGCLKIYDFLDYKIVKSLIFIGGISYGIYLIHQPMILWGVKYFNTLGGAAGAIAALPASILCIKITDEIIKIIKGKRKLKSNPAVFISLFLIIIILYFNDIKPDTRKYYAVQLILTTGFVTLVLYFKNISKQEGSHFIPAAAMFLITLRLLLRADLWIVIPAAGILFTLSYVILKKAIKEEYRAAVTAAVGSILILLAAELLLLKYSPIEDNEWGEFAALEIHPTRRYALIPNKETHLRYNNYDYILSTNSLGLAGPEPKTDISEDAKKILLIGDAFCMPEGIEYDKSLASLLNIKLNKVSEAEVYNGGVTGYGPAEQLPQLVELSNTINPDVVIYEFFVNEFYEVNLTREARLSNIGFIKNNNSEYKLNAANTAHYLNSLYGEALESITGRSLEWKYWKSLLHFYSPENNRFYGEENLNELRKYLCEMDRAARATNAAFIIIYVPGSAEIGGENINYLPKEIGMYNLDFQLPKEKLREMAEQLDIDFYDLTATLKDYPIQPVYFPASWHWNENGHKAAAAKITDILINGGYIKQQ